MDQQEIKKDILTCIKNGKPAPTPLPDVPIYTYPGEPVNNFINHLIGFDGRVIEFQTREKALDWLQKQPFMDLAQNKIYSSAPGINGNIAEDELADLRNAHKIKVCVTEGELGVGEMGAILVTDTSLKHAACALLSRRLFVLLDSKRIIGGLHEAYEKIKINEHQYCSFYTGPSATADIEAVHITGAQGPLVLTCLLYNCDSAPDTPTLIKNPNADSSVWTKSMEEDG